ncbi:MAG: replication endonuclease [Sterolibacteriaceae bacterium MAG5]|nr:replication endonuclease [Candidatus Nitricoxidireducens bremensis]
MGARHSFAASSRHDPFESRQQSWIEKVTEGWPASWKRDALSQHAHRLSGQGIAAANTWLLDQADKIGACKIAPNATDDDLLAIATKQAKRATDRAQRWAPRGMLKMRCQVAELCDEWGIEPPGEEYDDPQALARLTDPLWWRRRLRNQQGRERENVAIALGRVHSKRDIYVSRESLDAERNKLRRNTRILEATEAISEDGEVFTLADLAEHSLSNPTLRRNELMVRIKGFEEVANEAGHVGIFVTLTCPSRMHARLEASGMPNSSYDGTTPKRAQAYLVDLWARIRSSLRHSYASPYGLRIAEPHHDATPHWHLLLFVSPLHVDAVKNTIRRYALKDSPDERGAQARRVTFEDIDPTKGGATHYVAKYIGKNIDGSGIDIDENGVPAEESIARVTAWARIHGIHQFNFIGGPPVGLWRELRRIKEPVITAAPEVIGAAWRAAQKTEDRKADYAGLIRAVGGPTAKRTEQAIQLATATDERPGRYGWTTTTKPVGIYHTPKPGHVYRSERKAWQVRMRAGEFGRRFAGDPAAAYRPWTRVNNCAAPAAQGFAGDDHPHVGTNIIPFPRPGPNPTPGPGSGREVGGFLS